MMQPSLLTGLAATTAGSSCHHCKVWLSPLLGLAVTTARSGCRHHCWVWPSLLGLAVITAGSGRHCCWVWPLPQGRDCLAVTARTGLSGRYHCKDGCLLTTARTVSAHHCKGGCAVTTARTGVPLPLQGRVCRYRCEDGCVWLSP